VRYYILKNGIPLVDIASIFVYLLSYCKLDYTIWGVTLILLRHSQYSLCFLLLDAIFHATPWLMSFSMYLIFLIPPSIFIFHLLFISQLIETCITNWILHYKPKIKHLFCAICNQNTKVTISTLTYSNQDFMLILALVCNFLCKYFLEKHFYKKINNSVIKIMFFSCSCIVSLENLQFPVYYTSNKSFLFPPQLKISIIFLRQHVKNNDQVNKSAFLDWNACVNSKLYQVVSSLYKR